MIIDKIIKIIIRIIRIINYQIILIKIHNKIYNHNINLNNLNGIINQFNKKYIHSNSNNLTCIINKLNQILSDSNNI